MCIYFNCSCCTQRTVIYCESVDIYNNAMPTCDIPTYDPYAHSKHRKCHTCMVIIGVTQELANLVYRYPWLGTEGMAGLENCQEWELEGGPFMKERNSTWDYAVADEEQELVERLQNMGLGDLEGKEELNEGEAFERRKAATDSSSKMSEDTWGSSEATTMVEEGSVEEEKFENEGDEQDAEEEEEEEEEGDITITQFQKL